MIFVLTRPMPGFPDYEVESDGVIYSLKRGKRIQLATQTDSDGYSRAELWRDGQRFRIMVHVAVLLAFIGPKPDGLQGCHNDGDPGNNNLVNLRWDTAQSNQTDRIVHGTDCRGSRHGAAKLTEATAREVAQMHSEGNPPRIIAETLGVPVKLIYGITSKGKRRTWKHLEIGYCPSFALLIHRWLKASAIDGNGPGPIPS